MRTVNQISIAELEEKKSRFIAHLVKISEFESTLARLRAEHKKASHHVTAFRIINEKNQIEEQARDDGEPSGTSGMPVLKTLIGADLINVGMIVTRYFGGTKLGGGGLARAYAGAANEAIAAAKIVSWLRIVRAELYASFSNQSELEQKIINAGLSVCERTFLECGVKIVVEGAEEVLNSNEFAAEKRH